MKKKSADDDECLVKGVIKYAAAVLQQSILVVSVLKSKEEQLVSKVYHIVL